MKYILRIGCEDYLLPDNRGLSTVMETLSRARLIPFAGRKYDDRRNLIGFRHGAAPDVEVKTLPGSWKTVKHEDEPEAVECEVLSPVKAIGAPGRAKSPQLLRLEAAMRALPERAGGAS